MSKFLKFRCPNRPAGDSDFECRSSLGGVAISTLNAHDFSAAPWSDIRRCEKCGYVEITLEARDSIPLYRVLDKEEKIDFVPDSEFFGFISYTGRRVLK